MEKTLFGLLFCFTIQFAIRAHDVQYLNFTVDDGLSNNTVYYVMQDSKGFIWCCTESGVNRFDGSNWDTFTLEEGLADNENFKCYEDSDNRIWFLSSNGKFSFYSKGKIQKVSIANRVKNEEVGLLLNCVEDIKNGRIYFITSTRKLFFFDKKKQKVFWKKSKDKYFILAQYKNEIFAFSDNFFDNNLIATCLSNSNKKNEYLKFSTNNKTILPNYFIHNACPILLEKDRLVYLSTAGVHQIYKGKITTRFRFKINNKIISSVMLTKINNNLFFAGGDGVFQLKEVNSNKNNFELKNFFGNVMANHIIQDDAGNFWIASHNKGLYCLPKNYKNFRNVLVYNSKNQNETFSLTNPRSDELTIGLLNGNIAKYNLRTNKITFRNLSKPNIDNVNRIKHIFELNNSSFYIGDNLFLVENTNSKRQIFRSNSFYNTLKNYCINKQKSKLWLVSSQHLYEYNLQQNEISDSIFFPKRCNSIALNVKNELYVGTVYGLYMRTPKNEFVSLNHLSSLLEAGVSALHTDEEGLWVATQGCGIILLNNNKLLKVINKKSGLTSNHCSRLVSSYNKVFACTSSGLSIIDKKTFEVTNITTSDGLISNEVRDIYLDEKQHIYFATDKGVCYLNWKDINPTINPPRIYLRAFQVNDSIFSTPTNYFKYLYEPGFLSFQFASISFCNPQLLSYSYRLKGEEEWQSNTSGNISFYNLPPGQYEMEVRVKQYKSEWSKPLVTYLSVTPLWYQKTSIQILGLSLAILIILFIAFWRIQVIRERDIQKHLTEIRINELERRALAAQMNPHFIFNSLNALHQLVLDKETENALNYLSDFAKLVRQILNNSRKPFITIREEIEFLNNYLLVEKVRYNYSFDYEFAIDEDYDELLTIPPMLVQPIIENAIKYGVSTAKKNFPRIKVSVRQTEHNLVFCIQDNGIGFEGVSELQSKEKLSQSNAITIIIERLNLIEIKGRKGWIEIESESNATPTGTSVSIYIPI